METSILAWRLHVRISVMAWAILLGLLDCCKASAATLGSISHIPVPESPDIVVTTFSLPGKPPISDQTQTTGFISVVGRACKNMCSGVAGSGPNQFDCTTIANSLAAANTTSITLSPFLVTEWSFRSCRFFVTNQNPVDSVITNQGSVATVAERLAADCSAAHNAAGGLCLYPNVSAAVFVQHT